MSTRTFTRDQLAKLGVPHDDVRVVHREQVDEKRWSTVHHAVFRAEDGGPLWRVTYYEPATENNECDLWGNRGLDAIEAVQVHPYEATVTRYREHGTWPSND